jgi:carbonic anhydrase
MADLKHLFENNRVWADRIQEEDPQFFGRLATLQSPEYLWIGCADSRVPANQITGLLPGEVFVHRNIANVVVHSDLNCLSVLQFSVDVLRVKHVIVVGHYGCGGVKAALQDLRVGLVDNWLRHIQDVRQKHEVLIEQCADKDCQLDRLCDLNAVEQALNVCQTTVLREAWGRGQAVAVHAWVYGLSDGRLQDTGFNVSGPDDIRPAYLNAIARIAKRIDGVPRPPISAVPDTD